MILHISTDNKFINYSINQFEAASPGGNLFLIETPHKEYSLKYVRKTQNVIIAPINSIEHKKVLNELNKFKLVIFHCINGERVKIINNAPKNVNMAWIPWGFDLYDLDNNLNYYLPNTLKLTRTAHFFYNFKLRIENVFNTVLYSNNKQDQKRKAISRINFFFNRSSNLHYIQPFNKNIKQFDYYYYSIEETVGNCIDKEISDNNILIGNSSIATNNHADAFNILELFKTENRKIIVPLSYGNKKYGKQIQKIGYKTWGNQFTPILDLLPIEKYNEMLRSCNILIMPHIRPQAFGNILTALWIGAKVYLYKSNSLYKFFRSKKILVFSIEEELTLDNSQALEGLCKEEKRLNRENLFLEFSKQKGIDNVSLIISNINKL